MDIQKFLDENLSASVCTDQIRKKLAVAINEMIIQDFPALVQSLYRLDINESKLKTLLKENPEKDAGELIADMIIERQAEKLKSRQRFSDQPGFTDEERW